MIDVLEKGKLLGDENVIDSAQMLSVFRKPNTARVRDNWNSEPDISYVSEGMPTY